MDSPQRPILSATGVFAAALILALGWALCTQHAWEDYWITYRSAKNLATGHGLVHNVGDRLHTFTSPLGVLLPALSSLLTGNTSDDAALWIFRAMSITAFAGAMALMFITASRMGLHRVAAGFLAAWLLTDSKSLDFASNGMETSFLLLFLVYALWALFTNAGPRRWLHLGMAWGGLMWTRPDSFITIGALGLAVLLFNDSTRTGMTRAEWCQVLVKAGLVCTAVYLPWFIGSWLYYGTPVPHTIIAKAASADPKSLGGFVWSSLRQPFIALTDESALGFTFRPSYARFGGWPEPVLMVCRFLALLAYLIWLVPGVRWQARAASFAYAVFLSYLNYYPAVLMDWYVPGPAWLALLALAGLMERVLHLMSNPRWHAVPLAGAAAWIAVAAWMTAASTQLFAVQQRVIDGGNRRDIGLWLKDNAQPGDTVFLECLGYIGYYSGLRTYDYPGLSSREVVSAARECSHDWRGIASRLKPTWLVLRPQEALQMLQGTVLSANDHYELVKTFDVTNQLEELPLLGEDLLAFDSCFLIFHRLEKNP